MSQDDEDIILADLPDEELVEQMFDDLYDGLADEIAEGTQILLDRVPGRRNSRRHADSSGSRLGREEGPR